MKPQNTTVVIFCLIALAVIAAIVFFSHYFSKKATVIRKLKKAPLKKISGFTNGETARIAGKVQCTGEPLTAPLSGRKCACFSVLVEQKVSSGKSSHWKKLIGEEVAGEFVVRDGNSYARVDFSHVTSYIVLDRNYSSGFFQDATEELTRYLHRHGVESENYFGWNRTIRYREGILEEGEMIAVVGKGTWERVDTGQLSDEYGKVLRISAPEEAPVYLSDDPKTTTGLSPN